MEDMMITTSHSQFIDAVELRIPNQKEEKNMEELHDDLQCSGDKGNYICWAKGCMEQGRKIRLDARGYMGEHDRACLCEAHLNQMNGVELECGHIIDEKLFSDDWTEEQLLEHMTNNKEETKQMNLCECKKQDGAPCIYKAKYTTHSGMNVCGVHYKVMNNQCGPDPVNNNILEEDDMNSNKMEKEESMDTYVFHFLVEKVYSDVVVMPRVITNIPLDSEFTRYFESMRTKKPVDGLLALSTGNWHFWLLQKRLADLGYKFRVMVLSNKEMAKLDPETLRAFHDRATFSWANDGHTFFLKVEGDYNWGLDPLGLKVIYKAKTTKRAAEICRLSEMAYYSDFMNLDIMIVDGAPYAYYDGMNFISLKFALKMTKMIVDDKRRRKVRADIIKGMLVRVNIRITTPDGLIKGDAIIVDGLAHDVIAHSENLKGEIRTNGWVMATMFPHAPHHVAVWDTQSWINNRNMLRQSKHEADVRAMIKDLEDSFNEGVVPDWLMLTEDAHDDSGTPDMERLSHLMDRQYIRWQAHGLDIRAAQNLVYMATNGVILRMEREKVEEEGKPTYYRKTWTPMTNAFLGAVVTYESLVNVGGINFPNQTGEHSFFDGRFGWVMPGSRFEQTYNLHGGWDLDDTVKVILVKVYSSNQDKVARLYETGVIDPMIASIPITEDEAIYVAMLVRSPNGPGEYSLEYLDQSTIEDMPWHKVDLANVSTVDLAVAAEAQSTLLEDVTVGQIPTSINYTGEDVTKDQSWAMITAQRFNPGIGRICNSLMNWSMTFGASFPDEMLAVLEDMVDSTQQSHDVVSFEAITAEVDHLYEQMVDRVMAEGRQVDSLLAVAHPIPSKFANKMKGRMVAGRFTKFNRFFGHQVKYLRDMVLRNSFNMRNNTDLVKTIKKLPVSADTMNWAKNFYGRYTSDFKINAQLWKTPKGEDMNPFAVMHYEMMRTRGNQEIVDRMVAELRAFGGVDTHKRVLSLWHWILIGDNRQDRIIFQPGTTESVMDVLIEALIWRGLAQELPAS